MESDRAISRTCHRAGALADSSVAELADGHRFLEELAQTVESLNRDNAISREKIVFLEQQVAELKRTEATLSNTLVSAQSLAEDVKRTAQREADLVMKEAELKAGELIRQARVELADTQRDLSTLQKQRLVMVE